MFVKISSGIPFLVNHRKYLLTLQIQLLLMLQRKPPLRNSLWTCGGASKHNISERASTTKTHQSDVNTFEKNKRVFFLPETLFNNGDLIQHRQILVSFEQAVVSYISFDQFIHHCTVLYIKYFFSQEWPQKNFVLAGKIS